MTIRAGIGSGIRAGVRRGPNPEGGEGGGPGEPGSGPGEDPIPPGAGYAFFAVSESSFTVPSESDPPYVIELVGAGGENLSSSSSRRPGGSGGAYARLELEENPGALAITVGAPGTRTNTNTFVVDGESVTIALAEGGHVEGTSAADGGQAANSIGDVVYSGGNAGSRGFGAGTNGGGGGGAGAWRDGDGAHGQNADDNIGGLGGASDMGFGGDGGSTGEPGGHAGFPGGGGGGMGSGDGSHPRTGEAGGGLVIVYWGGHPLLTKAQIESELAS